MKPNPKKLQKECDDFNKQYPVGTPVLLKKDFIDEPVKTTVREKAFVLSGHSAVAFFTGVSGCYRIFCVKGIDYSGDGGIIDGSNRTTSGAIGQP